MYFYVYVPQLLNAIIPANPQMECEVVCACTYVYVHACICMYVYVDVHLFIYTRASGA